MRTPVSTHGWWVRGTEIRFHQWFAAARLTCVPVECHFSNLPDSNGTVIKMITFEPMIGTSPTPVLQSQRSDTTSIMIGRAVARTAV